MREQHSSIREAFVDGLWKTVLEWIHEWSRECANNIRVFVKHSWMVGIRERGW
jgi:hypothetical protein